MLATFLWLLAQVAKPDGPRARLELSGAFGVALFAAILSFIAYWFWRWRQRIETRDKDFDDRLKHLEKDSHALAVKLEEIGTSGRLRKIEEGLHEMRQEMREFRARLTPLLDVIDTSARDSILKKPTR